MAKPSIKQKLIIAATVAATALSSLGPSATNMTGSGDAPEGTSPEQPVSEVVVDYKAPERVNFLGDQAGGNFVKIAAATPPVASTQLVENPAIKTRDLSLRETFLLALLSPAKEDVSELVAAQDRERLLLSLSSGYWSPSRYDRPAFVYEAQSGGGFSLKPTGRDPTLSTSTALLDHLLSKAAPSEKQGLVNHGLAEAGARRDEEILNGRKAVRGSSLNWVASEATNKLHVLARHGGDLNVAVQATDSPKLIIRNAKVLLEAGQTLTRESVDHIVNHQLTTDQVTHDYHARNHRDRLDKSGYYDSTQGDALEAENGLLPAIVQGSGGKPFPEPITFTPRGRSLADQYSTNNPLALAVALEEPGGHLFEDMLERGAKEEDAKLYQAALYNPDPVAALKRLNDYGFNINARNSNGKTVRDYVEGTQTFDFFGEKEENIATLHKYLDEAGAEKVIPSKNNAPAQAPLKAIAEGACEGTRLELPSSTGGTVRIIPPPGCTLKFPPAPGLGS